MVVGSVGRQLGDYSVRGAFGAILSGTLATGGVEHDIGTGWLVTIGGSRRWVRGNWFGVASLTAGFSSTHTTAPDGTETDLSATDLRLGVIGGLTLWDRVSPYALARGFGGPVSWGDATGSDKHHYQLGGGVSVAVAGGFSALVDVSALGERSLSVGVALSL